MHIGEFTILLDRYCQLSNSDKASTGSLALFTGFFYQSLDKELRSALKDFPDDLTEAFSAATNVSRILRSILRKRKTHDRPSSTLSSQSSLKRHSTSSVNALQHTYANESIANLAQCFEAASSDFEFVKTVASVCSLTPNLKNIAQASKLDISGLRGGVDILRATPSYRHACMRSKT